ncbi:MAG: hypothetical protein ACQZ3M_09700 [cyanobacterium endosymbiont of Rhopalodia fuxianensis]
MNRISILAEALGSVSDTDSETLEAFTTKWKDRTDNKFAAFTPHSWNATIFLMLTAEATDTNTEKEIRSKIYQVANAYGIKITDLCKAIELVRTGKDINCQGARGSVDIDMRRGPSREL